MKRIVILLSFLLVVIGLWAQGTESFTNLPTNSASSYLERIWTGDDGVTWTAQGARTDQTITGKAICWGNSDTRNVISPVYPGGMGTLSFDYVRGFTGTNPRSLEVYVNGDLISSITVSATSNDVINYSELIEVAGNVYVEIRSTGAAQVKVDNLEWTGYAPAGVPLLSALPLSLSDFNYVEGSGPSSSQFFEVSGVNLDPAEGNVTVTANDYYEISADNTTFSNSFQIAYTDGEFTEVSVFVRLEAGLNAGLYENELITISGGDADNITVTVNGEVTEPPPTFGLDGYDENFAGFTSLATLPLGWEFDYPYTYVADFGAGGTTGGLRGNGVLGFLLTGSAPNNEFATTLTLENTTGEIITALDISYLGKVEALANTRHPEWTVTVNGTVVPELAYSTAGGVDELKSHTITGLNIAENQDIVIEWYTTGDVGTTGSRRQIGLTNLDIALPAALPAASPVFDPIAGTYYSAQSVTITSATAGATVYYTLDNSEPTEASLTDMPIAVNSTTTIKAKAFAEGYEPSVTITAAYTIIIPTDVTTVSALRAGTIGNTYRLTGEAVITFMQTLRNQKMIQDTSAGILIDDLDGIITSNYSLYDGIVNLTGTLSEYEGMLQFVPVFDPGAPNSSNNEVTPTVLTIDTLNNNFADYQAKLVRLESVFFTTADGIITFQNGTVYPISDGTGANFRTSYYNVDYINSIVPIALLDIVVLPNTNAAGNFVTARNADDIEIVPDVVATPTFDPLGGTYLSTVLVTINSDTEGAEIRYTTNGNNPDINSTLYEEPFEVSETATVKAIAFADEMTPSAIGSVQYTLPIAVNSVSALRSGTIGSLYKLTSEAILIYQQSLRNQKFIQDTGAGILIDDNDGIIETVYAINDGITDLIGTLTTYDNMIQIVPAADPGAASSVGNVVTPVLVTLANLEADYLQYQSRLVKVEDLDFTDADGMSQFAGDTSYNITDGVDTAIFRTAFAAADYLGTLIPTVTSDLTLIPTSAGTIEEPIHYLSARSLADFDYQEAFVTYDVEFLVKYNDTPIPGATVTFGILEGETGIDGLVNFIVTANEYDYTVNHPFFEEETDIVLIDENIQIIVNLSAPESDTLPVFHNGTITSNPDWTYINAVQRSASGNDYFTITVNTAEVVTPPIDVTNLTVIAIDFDARTYGGVVGNSPEVTISISLNNGLDWEETTYTRTPANTTLTPMTTIELGGIETSHLRVRFQTLSADGSRGAGLDNINIYSVEPETLDTPIITSITIDDGLVLIEWEAVTGADTYRIEASGYPYDNFVDVTDEGILDGSSWLGDATDSRTFYRVIAVAVE